MPELKVELFAWIGMDEMGSGALGLKQALVPAGFIPMVSVSQEKLEKHWEKAETQAALYGKKIFFCRFELMEIIRETHDGEAPS